MRHQYETDSEPEESELEKSDSENSDSEESDSEESYRKKARPKKSYPRNSYQEEADSEDDKERPAGDLRTKIFSTLKLIKTPSAFAFSTVDPFLPNPILFIPPLGTLGLPLSTDDAKKIISQASQSPFGKGEKTLIDTTVRKSWELNPNQFLLKNPVWNKVMEKILDTVTVGLGLEKGTGKVLAELYKLLLYEPGAFFKPHKDSEKASGMFATLVVCLPSQHEGGKLVLTHENEKYEFETAHTSSFSLSYAAWYSDITHEVLPVVSGYRLMLTYNLIRKTGFVLPSYNLVCGHVKQLSTLLEQYNSRLEKKDAQLPPILVHRLEHKYTKASLKLNTLKPRDLAQVQTLSQLSTKLGFDIYLGTWELSVNTNDEYGPGDDFEHQSLAEIVALDGELVMERLECPDGALIDLKPRNQDDPDEEDKESYTGNEGTPITYWYRDTVVILVPPSKQLDFICKFKSSCDSESIFEPLFCKLMQGYSKDPDQKSKVEQMCELALNQKTDRYSYRSISESKFPYFKQVVATALDLGRLDLFDKACKMTKDRIILDNACMLGHWAAINGLTTMTDRLMKGVQVASSVAEKIEFLKAVAEGFEKAEPEPSAAERVSLKQWSDEAVFTAAAKLEKLTKDDCSSLAQLCKTMDWSQFKSNAKRVVLKAVIRTKITFIKELMSSLQQELDEEQRSFVVKIIRSIWKKFDFDVKRQESSASFWWQEESKPVYLNENDVHDIVESTLKLLSSKCVEITIIPAMLIAIPIASKECSQKLFISLVKMILKNKLPGFKLQTKDAAPPPLHKRLVQAFLTKFLLENVGHEPQPPANWSLPACHCRCSACTDCSVVNRFLEDPRKESFIITCANKTRLAHLDRTFAQSTFDVTTTQGNDPKKPGKLVSFWQITKNRHKYQAAMSEWMKKIETATQTLLVLKNSETVDGRLEAYLEPYYSIIMNANIKELPNLESLVKTPELSESDENTAALNQSTSETCHKRGASGIHPLEDGLVKQTKL